MKNSKQSEVHTVVDEFEVPLDGSIYGVDVERMKLTFEVRDFGKPLRTLVVRLWADGKPYTAMASWELFTDELDAMRARMMAGNWDEALSQLTGMEDFRL